MTNTEHTPSGCMLCGGSNGHQAMRLHDHSGNGWGRNVIGMCPWAPEEILKRKAEEAATRATMNRIFDGMFPPTSSAA